MVSIEVFVRAKQGEPAESIGCYKFAHIPRIGEVVTDCGGSGDIPGEPMRIVEVLHQAAPEETRFDNAELAELFETPRVKVIGEAVNF